MQLVQLEIITNPIEHVNRRSRLKKILFTAGFTVGITGGIFGGNFLATKLESSGIPRQTLTDAYLCILVNEIVIRRLIHKKEVEYATEYKETRQRDIGEELKIHFLQVAETTLAGFNIGLGINAIFPVV